MRIFGRKEDRTIPSGGAVADNTPSWRPYSPASPAEGLAIADVLACVRVLAGAAASLPLVAYRRTSSGRVRLASVRLHDLLAAPAPSVTQANLVGTAMTHLLLHGNAFVGKFRGSDGRIEQLGCLDPTNVTVELIAGSPRFTVTDPATGRQSFHGIDDITHIRALSTDGLVGLSPLRECRLAIAYAAGMDEFAESFVRQGFRPSGILAVPAGTPQTAIDQTIAGLSERHAGSGNAHRVAVVKGEVNYTAMTGPL